MNPQDEFRRIYGDGIPRSGLLNPDAPKRVNPAKSAESSDWYNPPMQKPPGNFACTDCDQSFETGKEFSDHFKRGAGGVEIVGCKTRAEMKAEAKAA